MTITQMKATTTDMATVKTTAITTQTNQPSKADTIDMEEAPEADTAVTTEATTEAATEDLEAVTEVEVTRLDLVVATAWRITFCQFWP